jgi:hypothetical protein
MYLPIKINFICVFLLTSLMIMNCELESSDQTNQSEIAGSTSVLIFDASDFLDRLPRDHYITDANRMDVDWLFNNTALYMGSRSQYVM